MVAAVPLLIGVASLLIFARYVYRDGVRDQREAVGVSLGTTAAIVLVINSAAIGSLRLGLAAIGLIAVGAALRMVSWWQKQHAPS